jgi:hypothetical protein
MFVFALLLRNEDKLFSPSGVNIPGLPGDGLWRVGSVAIRSLIAVRIVVQYALQRVTFRVKFSYVFKKKKKNVCSRLCVSFLFLKPLAVVWEKSFPFVVRDTTLRYMHMLFI